MDSLDHTCMEAIESGRMARVMASRFTKSSSEETSCPQHEPSGEQQCDTMGVTAGRDPQLIQERKPYQLRPHCLRPDACGGYGDRHCGDCRRAMEGEQAA